MILDTKTNRETAPEPPAADSSPVDEIVAALSAVRSAAAAYFEVRRDAFAAKLRRYVLRCALLLIGGTIAATTLVTAVVLTVTGAADALGAAVGDRAWAGKLIVGLTLVVGAGVATRLAIHRKTHAALGKTVKKYEPRDARH